MRTLVLSDLHGDASRLERTLEHARFTRDDRLVIAGDLIDVGTDDVIALAEAHGATVLAGNHEVSAALGLRISPQHPESLERGSEFAERFASGVWPLAVEVEGFLITHAGVSATLSDLIDRAGGEVAAVAERLNHLFRSEVESARAQAPLAWEDIERLRLCGSPAGPLWFRPRSAAQLPSGLRQIVGHTPPEMYPPETLDALEHAGWLLVESGGHGATAVTCRRGGRILYPSVRYAVIEDGTARLVEA